jgi:hypothetical protein
VGEWGRLRRGVSLKARLQRAGAHVQVDGRYCGDRVAAAEARLWAAMHAFATRWPAWGMLCSGVGWQRPGRYVVVLGIDVGTHGKEFVDEVEMAVFRRPMEDSRLILR